MRYLHITSFLHAREELNRVGVEPYGVTAMLPKMKNANIILEGIECKVANILKQEMLSIGGDVAVARGAVDCSISKTDAIIIGTVKQIGRLADKIAVQPFGLGQIAKDLRGLLANLESRSCTLHTPSGELELGTRTFIMGILNVTPDSFSDGGMLPTTGDAIARSARMEEEGADIIDIGGESTRPGAASITADEEIKRILPVIRELRKKTSLPISIDTQKAEVARVALNEGVDIINDISALRYDKAMVGIAAEYGVPVVLMHMRGVPTTMQEGDLAYESLTGEVLGFLRERIAYAVSVGIAKENIIVDPGIGFGKSVQDNAQLIRRLPELKTLGHPILVGPSRKGFIGLTAGGGPHDRLEGTAAAVTAAIMNGAHIVRVHDVKFMKRVAGMADAIVRED